MSDFRSQLKATPMKSLKKHIDQDDAMVGTQSTEFLQLEDGKTLKIRIFPAHPGVENFYIARKCYWLPLTGKDGDTYRGTVNDSKLHGGTKFDLVEEYIKWAKKKIGNDAEKLDVLVGTGPKSNSLNPQYSWLCYADRVNADEALRAKLWEFKKMVRDQLNKLACSEDADETIEVDPFTDPDEGLPVMVTFNKNPNKKKGENFYDVAFPKKSNARPLTDEEIEYFMSQKPLNEVIGKYGMSDFERALDGLQNFDDEHEIGMFDDDDWLEHVEEIKAQYDAEESEDDDDEPKKKTAKKPARKEEDEDEEDEKPAPKKKPAPQPEEEEEEDDDEEEDEFTDMDRSELKTYINDNELEVTVKKSMSDDDIRAAIREEIAKSANKGKAKPEPEEEDEEEEDDADEKPKAKMTLEQIRAKLRK